MNKCATCNNKFTKTKKGVKCVMCSNSFHLECTVPIVTNVIFSQIESGSINWNCNECKAGKLSNSVILNDESDSDTSEISNLKHTLCKFSSDLAKMKSQQDIFTASLNSLNTNFQELLKASAILSDHEKRITSLESSNEKLNCELKLIRDQLGFADDVSRSKNFLLHGIPVCKEENRPAIIKQFLTFLEVPSCENQIIRTSRMRIKNPDSNIPPLIVECDAVSTKLKIFDAFKVKKHQLNRSITPSDLGLSNGNGSTTIFSTDHLSAANQLIMKKARELKTSLNYKFVWSQRGNVLCRKDEKSKIIKLKSIEFIEVLLNNNS